MAHISCWPFSKRWSNLRPKKIKSCSLAMVGDQGSGKTSFIFRLTRDRMPTVKEQFRSVLATDEMDVLRNGKTIRVVVHDQTADEDYAKVRALTYTMVDGVIVCLSLDSQESLRRLELDWVPEIRHLCQGKPVLLVGTKKDLRDNPRSRSAQTTEGFVTKKQGKQAAKSMGAIAYLECSALDSNDEGNGVKRVFGRALRETLKRK